MEKDPERRFPGMRALSDALHEVLQELNTGRRAAVALLIRPPFEAAERTTAEVAASARAEDVTTLETAASPARVTQDQTVTVPVGVTAPESAVGSIEEAAPSHAPLVAVVVAALLAGIGGGLWIALRALAP
jgi:hypothetical protein